VKRKTYKGGAPSPARGALGEFNDADVVTIRGVAYRAMVWTLNWTGCIPVERDHSVEDEKHPNAYGATSEEHVWFDWDEPTVLVRAQATVNYQAASKAEVADPVNEPAVRCVS